MEPQLPFLGMAREIERLSLAFATGDSLLLLGPQGSGKTRLIQEALSGNHQVLYIAWEPMLHALLTAMARALITARHAGFVSHAGVPSGPGRDAEDWLAVQTSVHLKGLLWSAVESSPMPMMLDGVVGASFPTYRFLQRIHHTRGMALFAASRDALQFGCIGQTVLESGESTPCPPAP